MHQRPVQDGGRETGQKRFGARALGGLASVALLAMAGAVNAAPAPNRGDGLVDFFRGRLRGAGTEQDREHSAPRSVAFSGTGQPIAGGIRLTYDLVFSDGERQHRVWTFLKTSQGRYIGRRADLVGDAQVTQSGNDIHMSYIAKVTTKSGVHDVNFDEHFTGAASGTLVNRIKATYLFFTVATGEITLQKVGGCAAGPSCRTGRVGAERPRRRAPPR
jgi:hypothetical protein